MYTDIIFILTDHLIVVVHNAKEAKSKSSKQPVGSLNGSRLVDSVRCSVSVWSEVKPAVSVVFSHLNVSKCWISRVGAFNGVPLH